MTSHLAADTPGYGILLSKTSNASQNMSLVRLLETNVIYSMLAPHLLNLTLDFAIFSKKKRELAVHENSYPIDIFQDNLKPSSLGLIDPYHSMSKQKILPVEPLIQCEAGRAKTMQRQSLYSPRTPKWPPSDKGELSLDRPTQIVYLQSEWP